MFGWKSDWKRVRLSQLHLRRWNHAAGRRGGSRSCYARCPGLQRWTRQLLLSELFPWQHNPLSPPLSLWVFSSWWCVYWHKHEAHFKLVQELKVLTSLNNMFGCLGEKKKQVKHNKTSPCRVFFNPTSEKNTWTVCFCLLVLLLSRKVTENNRK